MTTYTQLKADIASWKASDILDPQIDTFIDLAEARHRRDFQLQIQTRRARAVGQDSRYLALPDPFLKPIRLWTIRDSGRNELNFVRPDGLVPRNDSKISEYTVHRELEFNATADADDSFEMVYFVPFTPLSDAAPSNWLSENAYDAYLFAALAEAEAYDRNPDKIQTWSSRYTLVVNELIEEDRKKIDNQGVQQITAYRYSDMDTP